MAQNCEKSVPDSPGNVCNAGLAGECVEMVSRDRVLTVLRRQESSIRHLQVVGGLSPDSGSKFTRERWEITQGKLALLASLEKEMQAVPAVGNLMGEKPILDHVRDSIRSIRAQANALMEMADDGAFPGMDWNRCDAAAFILETLLSKFSGSAEEQPLTREEPPAMGTAPVTPGATLEFLHLSPLFLSRTLATCSMDVVESVAETALEAIERRGGVTHWSLTGA